MDSEKIRLEKIAQVSKYAFGVNSLSVEYSTKIFKENMIKGSVLEMGPAEGVMTDRLYPLWKEDYTVVDGAAVFVENIVSRYPEIVGHVSLFEKFLPERKFDNIILGHVLEHVESPVKILKNCKEWLNPHGRIVAAVPNSNSLHRQAAVIMGMLKNTNELNEADIYHGHRRVYCLNELENDFEEAGLHIIKSGGYWLKPLSNSQLEEQWSDELMNAYMELGEKYPDIAAEIYVVAE